MMILNYKSKKELKEYIGKQLDYTETSMFGAEYLSNGSFCGCNRPYSPKYPKFEQRSYLCDTCGSILVKSGEHEPLSKIYGSEIPFRNSEICPVCNKVANLMYYPKASLAKPLKQLTIVDAENQTELIKERKLLYDKLAELNSSFADFRKDIRSALFPFWPNNPGVSDSEIIDAIDRCVKLNKSEEL